MRTKTLPALSGILACVVATAAPGQEVSSEILVQSATSWDGAAIAYPAGTPQLTVVRITLQPGAILPWHCHPVPLAGVVTRGRLTVSKPDGETIVVEAGQGLVEVSRQWHRGQAEGEVEIIVVYAGSTDLPTGFGEDAAPELAALCG